MSDQDSTFRWYEGQDDRPTGWFAEGGAPRRSRVGRPPSRATYLEPAREVPVHAETDILVVGGGPAGCAAATSAARLGADVLLVERYGHLGGLSTPRDVDVRELQGELRRQGANLQADPERDERPTAAAAPSGYESGL